jgi:ElaB/YqjD/DUF883 family membrane-anchored ribosome-binding protein
LADGHRIVDMPIPPEAACVALPPTKPNRLSQPELFAARAVVLQTNFPRTEVYLMSNMSNSARDAVNEAKGAVHEAGNAAAAASGDLRNDLAALRADVARLAQQIADILAARGNATWRLARSNVEGALTEAQDKGKEAVDAVREVGDNMAEAIDRSLQERPYTTLALALGIGFLFGATWRR